MLNKTINTELHTTHSSPNTSPTLCLFFNLPAELRNFIYTFSYNSLTIEASLTSTPRIQSFYAIPKTIVHKGNAISQPRKKGLPIWLMTCTQILREGMNVLSREYAFTSYHPALGLARSLRLRELSADDVLNRLVFAAVKTVVFNVRTRSYIKDVHPDELAQDSETEVTTELGLARWLVDPTLGGQMATSGARKGQRQRTVVVKLGPWDEDMLNILHEAGAAVKELRMHWTYNVSGVLPGDEVVLRNEALERWVGGLERVRIRVDSRVDELMAKEIVAGLGERAAKRLVARGGGGCDGDGETVEDGSSVSWREEVRNRCERPFGHGRIKRYVTVGRSAG